MIGDVCLSCLSDYDLFDVFKSKNDEEQSYASILKSCFDIHVHQQTGTNMICVNCIDLLNTADKFKQQILNTIYVIESSFKNKTISTINIKLLDKIIETKHSENKASNITDDVYVKTNRITRKEIEMNDNTTQNNCDTVMVETISESIMKQKYNKNDTDIIIDKLENNFITSTMEKNDLIYNTKHRNENINNITTGIEDIQNLNKLNNILDTKERKDSMTEDTLNDNNMSIDTNAKIQDNNLSLLVDETMDVNLNRMLDDSPNIEVVEEIYYCDYEETPENTLTIDNNQDGLLIQNQEDRDVDIKIILDGDLCEGDIDDGTDSLSEDINTIDVENTMTITSKSKHSKKYYPPKQPYALTENQTECHRQTNLITHVNVHYPDIPCHICNKKYASKGSLAIHLRSHLDGKFECKYCDKTFSKYNTRHSHMWRAHNSRSQFSCALCDAKFDKLSVKHAHMKTAHGLTENVFQCEECGKSFYTSDARSTHVRRVHRKQSKKFRCAFCDQTFLQIKSLQRHTEKFHKENNI